MIHHLRGTLIEATPLTAVIEVGGLGYLVNIPVTVAERLPKTGEEVRIYTTVIYREDSQTLYGFNEPDERAFFLLLVEKVSGIGPRIALSIMSRLPLNTLKQAIQQEDADTLAQCPGIGKKTAQRLIVELKDKLPATLSLGGDSGSRTPSGNLGAPAVQNPQTDAVQAMVALGYRPADAEKAVEKASQQLGEAATTEALIRAALR